MSEKAVIRIAVILAALIGLWFILGGSIPYIKIRELTPSDDIPTFERVDHDDNGGYIDDSRSDRNYSRDFVGDEYDPDKERKIDEMIEDVEEQERERYDDE